jgi:nucleoid DNA-binding protein
MTITKRELTAAISRQVALNRKQTLQIIDKALAHITEALATGGRVELRQFGVFTVKIRKARVGRNPLKPEVDIPIPAVAAVEFRAGKELRQRVILLPPVPRLQGRRRRRQAVKQAVPA